jgi:hypothetical protein
MSRVRSILYVHRIQFLMLFCLVCNLGESQNAGKFSNTNSIFAAPCVNEDFESTPVGAYTASNAINGWLLYSGNTSSGCNDNLEVAWTPGATEFSIVATPIAGFPGVGTLPHSPLGGQKVAQLNNYTNNYSKTRLSTTFSVTATNWLFQYAFAGYVQAQNGSCCNSPGFFVKMKNCSGGTIACGTVSLTPACGGTGFTASQSGSYISWQVKTIDLSPYIGTCVTFDCWCTDNSFGGHYGCAAFDARCGSAVLPGLNQVSPIQTVINYCQGSNAAQLHAPPGYASYSWTAASSLTPISASQSTLALITITNPTSGGVYSLTGMNSANCMTNFIYSLTPTQVNILGIGSAPTCTAGAAGAVTVQPWGSSVGYTYLWTNSSNSVIGTGSVVSNLAPGVYNVTVSATGNTACGTASGTVAVQSGTIPPGFVNAVYCGTVAYLPGPPGGNYKWYNGTTAVTGTAGTVQNFTVTGAANGAIYSLGYINGGCRDSLIYTLVESAPGTITSTLSSQGCYGLTGAAVSLTFTPNANQLPGTPFHFTVTPLPPFASGSATYSGGSGTLAITQLTNGAVYQVTGFDGMCHVSAQIAVTPIVPNYSAIVVPPYGMVCSGNTVQAGVYPSALSPAQFTYSWSPPVFTAPGTSTQQFVTFAPMAVPGSTGAVIYTVVVTPTIANCPVTATYQIVYGSPPVPSLSGPAGVCKNDPPVTLTAGPAGGTFAPVSFSQGVVTPASLATGNHNISYAVSNGSCVASAAISISVIPAPTIIVTGPSSVCAGETVTLSASGGIGFIWNTSQPGSTYVTVPLQGNLYTVTGHSANCTSSATHSISVHPLPALSASGAQTICIGTTVTLTVTGASQFSWNNGASGSVNVVTPAAPVVYTITGTDQSSGCSSTVAALVHVSECVDIQVLSNGCVMSAFPNPCTGKLTISAACTIAVGLYDAAGRLVYEEEEAQNRTLDLSAIADGAYTLLIRAGTSEYKKKLIRISEQQ